MLYRTRGWGGGKKGCSVSLSWLFQKKRMWIFFLLKNRLITSSFSPPRKKNKFGRWDVYRSTLSVGAVVNSGNISITVGEVKSEQSMQDLLSLVFVPAQYGSWWNRGFAARLSPHLCWCDTTEASWILLVEEGCVCLFCCKWMCMYTLQNEFYVRLSPFLSEWDHDQ